MELTDLDRLCDQSDWLRRLARKLVGSSAAEDLAQDTVLKAIEAPPAADRPLRPWLVRVLRNTARMRFRADERRVRREHAVAEDPAAPDPSVQLLETHRALCELVLALDEPLRRTVVAHYFDGLTLAELARRDGVADGTVRWRHARALTLIREGLDQRAGGDRGAWTLALAPMLKLPSNTTIAIAGGWIMNKLIVGALVVVVSAAGGLWWWRSPGDEPGRRVAPVAPVAAPRSPGASAADRVATGDATTAERGGRRGVRLVTLEQRRELAERIAAARARRAAAASAPAGSPGTAPGSSSSTAAMDTPENVLVQVTAALKEVRGYVSECVAHAGTSARGFNAAMVLTGDPDVGTLIDASELTSLDGKPLPGELDDCVRALMQTLELPPIAVGDAFKVSSEFTFDDEPKQP